MTEFQRPLSLESYPVPGELAPGEVLVRIQMAGICGTDIHLWLGQLPVPLPLIMGHETVGAIEAIGGANAIYDWRGNQLRTGDRIGWASGISCGQCYYCRPKRQPTRCLSRKAYGISYRATEAPHLRGGYSDWILLRPETAMFRLPETVPTESLIGGGCALTTALHGLERCPVQLGDTVVVQGAGPVGLAAVAMANASGAAQIIVVGGPAHRLQMAGTFGATDLVSLDDYPTAGARRQRVLDLTGGFGADIVIECVGMPEAVNESLHFCRDGARLLVLGQYANAGNIEFNPHTITRKQLEIHGSWGFEPRHVDQAIRLLENPVWRDRFARQITHRYRLEEANQALETVRTWQSGKAVLLP